MSQEEVSFQESNARSLQRRNPDHKFRIIDILNRKFTLRVNIMGTNVFRQDSSNSQTLMIDDGSDKIAARNFNNSPSFLDIDIGNAVMIIGKPREFNNEVYIATEIIRKIDPLWLKIRNLEIKNHKDNNDIISMIKDLDNGKGVYVEKILEKSNDPNARLKIDLMLKKGDLFEVCPGRLKVLE